MTDLYYQHQWDSPELKQAAAECGITPSGWIRPGGEHRNPTTRWWFGISISPELLVRAIRWRLDWMGFTGPVWEYEGPLILNLEGFTQAYKPDDPAFGPRTWVETRREVQRQCRLIAPKAKWCEYGLPSCMHQWGDVPLDLNGILPPKAQEIFDPKKLNPVANKILQTVWKDAQAAGVPIVVPG